MLERARELAEQSLTYGAWSMVEKAIGFLLIPIFTRALSPERYGVLALVVVTLTFSTSLLSFGLFASILRFYPDAEDEDMRRKVVGTTLWFLTFAILFPILVLVPARELIAEVILGGRQWSRLVLLLLGAIYFQVVGDAAFSLLRSREEAGRFGMMKALQTLLYAGAALLAVIQLDRGVEGIVEARLLSNGSVWLLLVPAILWRNRSFSLGVLRETLDYGLPIVPHRLAQWTMSLADRYLLRWLTSTRAVGLYTLGAQVSQPLTFLSGAFQTAFGPYVFKIYQQDDAPEFFARVTKSLVVILGIVALTVAIWTDEIVALVGTRRYAEAGIVVPALLLGAMFGTLYTQMAIGIPIAKKTRAFAVVSGAGAVVNVLGNLVLIPPFGMGGAAAATVISSLAQWIGGYRVSQRHYAIKYDWSALVKVFVIGLGAFGLALGVGTFPLISRYVAKAALTCLFPVALLMTGAVNRGELWIVLRLLPRVFKGGMDKMETDSTAPVGMRPGSIDE